MKIRRYVYSCMFDMPSQKPVQQYNYKNIQNSKIPKHPILTSSILTKIKGQNMQYIIRQR